MLAPTQFPARGEELLETAAAESAAPDVLERIRGLAPDQEFEAMGEVLDAVGPPDGKRQSGS
jgi:hypothetical protein